jgi:hypothetical protein
MKRYQIEKKKKKKFKLRSKGKSQIESGTIDER